MKHVKMFEKYFHYKTSGLWHWIAITNEQTDRCVLVGVDINEGTYRSKKLITKLENVTEENYNIDNYGESTEQEVFEYWTDEQGYNVVNTIISENIEYILHTLKNLD